MSLRGPPSGARGPWQSHPGRTGNERPPSMSGGRSTRVAACVFTRSPFTVRRSPPFTPNPLSPFPIGKGGRNGGLHVQCLVNACHSLNQTAPKSLPRAPRGGPSNVAQGRHRNIQRPDGAPHVAQAVGYRPRDAPFSLSPSWCSHSIASRSPFPVPRSRSPFTVHRSPFPAFPPPVYCVFLPRHPEP